MRLELLRGSGPHSALTERSKISQRILIGERADLQRLTENLMARMERDLDTRLEWAAVVHRNTEHPHVHIVLRGIRQDGAELRLERGYIQHGLRAHAEDLCTAQLGYRTELDAAESQRREVTQQRFTSLDWLILRNAAADDDPEHLWVAPASNNVAARL